MLPFPLCCLGYRRRPIYSRSACKEPSPRRPNMSSSRLDWPSIRDKSAKKFKISISQIRKFSQERLTSLYPRNPSSLVYGP